MGAASNHAMGFEYAPLEPQSVESEAVSRLRLATGASILPAIVLPAVDAVFFPKSDRLTFELHSAWFVLTVIFFAATWHPWFHRIWKQSVLLFAVTVIVSSGILSIKGAMLAPFMFLLVLLPAGGTILPWEPSWQATMNLICLLLGVLFASEFQWPNQLVISGLEAMIVASLGSLLVTVAITKQRVRISANLQTLALSEEKFRKIFETSGSLIAIHSIPDGKLVDVNPAWEKTFGYCRDEAVGRSPIDLGLLVDHPAFVHWLRMLKIGDAGAGQVPVVFRRRGENRVHCLCSWTTLCLNGRDCVLVVGHDVSARVQAEEELRHNRQVLLNQERLKAVGELASGIAHDLNNSLNALQLWLEVLCAAPSATSRRNDALQWISRIVRDASATIGRLQDFARRRHDRPVENIDLNAILVESVQIAKSTLEEKNFLLGKSIRVEMDVPRLPPVLADPSELRQLILNLLLNAQDAMPAGGTIRISGHVELEAIAVSVEDEGHGIPPEHLNRIFDPFFSTKGERGTGLGLSIAYSTMARIGGSISAGNRIEGGAVFTLKFPIVPPKAIPHAQQCRSEIQPRRVMVTDDDRNNQQAFRALLESRGHAVITASSGPEALEKLMQENLPVDVIFCDLGMPLMNGWEVARRVKSLERPPAFYLLTGWAVEIPADHPDRPFVDAVIAKPVDPKTLDDLLARYKPRQFHSASSTGEHNGEFVHTKALIEHKN